MGQYYYVVNVDKRQYLHPHKFGDGLKLLEFGSSGGGTMQGLGVLLADGNGRGGGDLLAHTNHDEGIYGSPCQDTHPIVGSWAGDRIVVAGDYADPGKHVPADLCQRLLEANLEEQHGRKGITGDEADEYAFKNCNLHSCAAKFFEDVSDKVLLALAADICVREELSSKLANRREYHKQAYPLPAQLEDLVFGQQTGVV